MKIQGIKMKMTQLFKEDRAVPVTPLKLEEQADISVLNPGDSVRITGISKGKGFQGVVKRHGFHGGPKSHGQKDRLRAPGSIGDTNSARVVKGKKMAGRMGSDRITLKEVTVVDFDKEQKILFVKGPLPGNVNGLLTIIHKGKSEN